jgi:hypothetical protein
MRKQLMTCVGIFVLYACGVLIAQSQQVTPENFQWSGELVSFDGTGKTVTVKARSVSDEAVNDLKRFKAGDRVLLWWSGFETRADGIRRVMPYTDTRKADDRFMLPVELVSTDAPHQYITFRLRVPDSHGAALTSLKPGEWVTATSAHRASGQQDAIVSIQPYTASSARTSN